MRKAILLPLVGVVVLGAAGAGYYVVRSRDHLRQGMLALQQGDMRRAQIELRNAVRDQPGSAPAHYELGIVEARSGDPVAGEKDFRAALAGGYDPLAVKPMLAQAYLDQQHYAELLADFPMPDKPPEFAAHIGIMRAVALLRMHDAEKAQAEVAVAEQLAPNMADATLVAAQIAFARGDMATAGKKVDRTLEIDPRNGQALIIRSDLQSAAGDRPGALKTLDAAIAASPGLASARLGRANLLIMNNDDARAKADVDAVLAADSHNLLGLYIRAILMTRAKDWQGADTIFTQLGPLLPRFQRAFFFAAIAKTNLGQLEQASDFATRYVTRNPEDTEGVKLLARIAIASKRLDQAVDILTKAISNGQADAEMLDLLGRAYSLAGQPSRAVQTFQKASNLAPENVDILTHLASTRLGMGDAGGAATDLEKSLQLSPKSSNLGEALVVAALAAGDIPRAQAALTKLHDKDGDTETVGNLTGLIKMMQVDLDGARAQFEAVLRDHPKSLPAKLNLAKIALLQGRSAEAENLLGEVLDTDPTNDSALSSLVGMMLNSGRIGRAVAIVQKAKDLSPGNAAMTAALADLDVRAGDADKAMTVLDQAPKDQASLPVLLGARARAQVALNRIGDARDTYQRILADNPNDLDARARLTEMLVASNDYAGARAVLQEGLRLSPKNFGMMETLTRVDLKASGVQAAVDTAERLAKDPANLPEARLLKGDVYVLARQFDKAAETYAAELKAQPATVLATRLAVAQVALNRNDLAIQTLTDWVTKNPDDVVALEPLASLLIQTKNYDGAQKYLNVIIARRPNDAPALNNLAWIYQLKNDPRARVLAQKAFALSPGPEMADTLGWILTTQGQSATGLPLLRQASARMGNNPTVQYHYAVALKDSGQRDEAVRALTVAAASPVDYPEKADAQKLLKELSGQ